jgi:hypothetical protein
MAARRPSRPDLRVREHPQVLADLDEAAADLAALADRPVGPEMQLAEDPDRGMPVDPDPLVETDRAALDPDGSPDLDAGPQVEAFCPDPDPGRGPKVVVAREADPATGSDLDLVGLDLDVLVELAIRGDRGPIRPDRRVSHQRRP